MAGSFVYHARAVRALELVLALTIALALATLSVIAEAQPGVPTPSGKRGPGGAYPKAAPGLEREVHVLVPTNPEGHV